MQNGKSALLKTTYVLEGWESFSVEGVAVIIIIALVVYPQQLDVWPLSKPEAVIGSK